MFRLSLTVFRDITTTTYIFSLAINFRMAEIAETCSSVNYKVKAFPLHTNQAQTGGSIIEPGTRSSGRFTASTRTRYPLYRGCVGLGAGLIWS